MSSNPFFAVLFLGMGYNQLSMNPSFIPAIRPVARGVTVRAARKLLDKAMTFATSQEIAEFLIAEVSHMVRVELTPFIREIRGGEGCAGARFCARRELIRRKTGPPVCRIE